MLKYIIQKTISNPFELVGANAKTILPVGVLVAFFLPETNEFFKPAAPYILALLVSVAMVRLDIVKVLKDAMQPVRLLQNTCLALALLVVVPLCLYYLADVFNLSGPVKALITWYAVSPPIGTTIWMCVFLGFSAPIAMEIVLLTNLLAPFTGPFMGEILLGTAVPITALTLSFRLGAILFGGIFVAVFLKWWLGEACINTNSRRLDGIATFLLLAFLIPVFDGVSALVYTMPFLAFGFACLATGLNFGHQIIIFLAGRLAAAIRQKSILPGGTRSIAVVSGNRNLGLYYAVLPTDPIFSMFVAAYQIPIYLTPMIAGWFGDQAENKRHNYRSNRL